MNEPIDPAPSIPDPDRLPSLPVARLRLGVVSFLNMFPLYNGLQSLAPDWEILPAPPSRLLSLLSDGACDLAMIPAFDYLTNQERLGLLANSCIATRTEAESVLILSDVPIAEAKWLELDNNSHTSNALARVLLRGPLNRPDMPLREERNSYSTDRAGAYVRIGDRAMQERSRFRHCIDMGQAWTSWQKMPFVFAVWATRGQMPWEEIATYLAAVRDDNLEHIRARLAASPSVLPCGISMDFAVRYFTDSLCYTLGDSELAGLRQFHKLLLELNAP